MDWAFRSFDEVTVAHKGAAIDQAPVWLGDKATVPVATERDIVMTVPRGAHKPLSVKAVYDGPIKAPVTVGQKVGELRVEFGDAPAADYPLVAMASTEKLGPIARAAEGIAQYIWEPKH